jgi:biopolymer transport protein ExbD
MIKKTSKVTSEFSTSSMSDINFLLLIFFLVTTMFAVDQGLPMSLPGESSNTVKLKSEDVLKIQAFPNGAIQVKGKGPIALNEIELFVKAKLAVNPEMVIVIETHPNADYSVMIDILDELRLADAKKISLKTMKLGA